MTKSMSYMPRCRDTPGDLWTCGRFYSILQICVRAFPIDPNQFRIMHNLFGNARRPCAGTRSHAGISAGFMKLFNLPADV